MPIAAIVNGQKYAVHSDHLNTPRQVVNDSAQVVWQWRYSGFGEEPPTTAKTRFADTATNPNPRTTNLTVPGYNLRYAGQYFDGESGLNYNYFRKGWKHQGVNQHNLRIDKDCIKPRGQGNSAETELQPCLCTPPSKAPVSSNSKASAPGLSPAASWRPWAPTSP